MLRQELGKPQRIAKNAYQKPRSFHFEPFIQKKELALF